MKFAFIDAEKASHKVSSLCRLLGVTRQGYYAYAKRPESPRVKADAELRDVVRIIFADSRETYGSPRVLRELQRRGFEVGKRRIERMMRGMGLTPPAPRRHCRTTVRDAKQPIATNALARNFKATKPNQRWVTDITYVWTDEGWAYVAAILDLFSRAVVGWAIDATLATTLPLAALSRALQRRCPERGLLHHSDQGVQYTSSQYRDALSKVGVVVSMSRRGNCWDNAVAESFFSTLKGELISRKTWRTRAELHQAVFEYIEVFYNRKRLHSTLNYKTPVEVEKEHALAA